MNSFFKTIFTGCLAGILLTLGPVNSLAQTEEEAAEKARSIFSNLRFQNTVKEMKENPAAVVDAVEENSEDIVRNATRAFNENKDKIDQSKLETAAGKVKEAASEIDTSKVADQAISALSLTKMLPVPESTDSDVPATRRPPGGMPVVARPVAEPVGEALPPIGSPSVDQPAIAKPTNMVVQESSVEPLSNVGPTSSQIPTSSSLTPGNVPAPQALSPRYETKAIHNSRSNLRDDQVEILAKESVLDDENGLLTFRGDVNVYSTDFDIKCDKLEIHTAKGSTGQSDSPGVGGGSKDIRKIIASGGMVEITRVGPDGKKQIAIGRRAEYDKVTEDMILTGGPPYIQDGENFVRTTANDAKVIMRGNGKYEITGTDNRSHIKFKVPGKSKTDGVGIGAGLGGAINGLQ